MTTRKIPKWRKTRNCERPCTGNNTVSNTVLLESYSLPILIELSLPLLTVGVMMKSTILLSVTELSGKAELL